MSMSINASKSSVTLENLRPHSFYNVSVRAYTKYGHGNQVSAVLEVLSGEHGELLSELHFWSVKSNM